MTTAGFVAVSAGIGFGIAAGLSNNPVAYLAHIFTALIVGAALMALGSRASR
ncbi:hypothetical protein [Mycolicibacter kumamotonensis]|uniref:hypothetical protein n=1 Tax=Mycolicibacter kumamotonensis TaxID=354243 RepID=UPI0013F4C055|nr:hypothetical protein [Mycolicibacter kumamotonensis]